MLVTVVNLLKISLILTFIKLLQNKAVCISRCATISIFVAFFNTTQSVKVIQLHDKQFEPFISANEINTQLQRLAAEVAADLQGETPIFIGVLNGAFMVVSDFVKHYTGNCEVSFVKVASYEGMGSTGEVKQLIGLNQNLEGRSVVIIEDIVDTGNTVEELIRMFADKGLKQLKLATLFFKPEAYKKDIKLDYVGFEIPNKFIVGYGLDYDGLGRNLPEVYQLHA